MKTHTSKTGRLALFTVLLALCLAIQLTPRPPNVEFTSFFSFVVGFVFGVIQGVFFGCVVMFANGFLSPYGIAGFIMPFQIVGMAAAGFLGGVYRKMMPQESDSARFCAEISVFGALIALVYDIITNLGVGFQFFLSGMDLTLAMITAIAYGALFSVIHILSNTAVFTVLTPPLMKILDVMTGGE